MKQLYEAIKTQLQNTVNNEGAYNATTPPVTPIEVYQWNKKQFDSLTSKEIDNTSVPMNFPCIMVEFANTKPNTLGMGIKIYDDLQVKIHFLYRQEAPADGSSIEESLEVYPASHNIRMALELWYSELVSMPGSGIFVWNDSHEDEEYSNLYHLIHEYGTTWVDTITEQPTNQRLPAQVADQTVPQPITLEDSMVYNPPPYINNG